MAVQSNSSDRNMVSPECQNNCLEPGENTESTGLIQGAENKESLEKQSLSRIDDAKPGPKKVSRSGMIIGCLIDGVGIMLCVGIIVFSILVRKANGNEAGQYEQNLVEVAGIVSRHFECLHGCFFLH